MAIEQAEVVKAMSRADFYPQHPSRVEHIQTHISHVFVCDNEAYKIKKPVNFGFLDFTTLEKRRFYCEQEVLLNRRLAADVYLGVTAITTDAKSGIALNGDGEIVEYAVKMKRIPTDKMLKSCCHLASLTMQ